MLKIMFTSRMKRDVKRMKRRGKDMEKLIAVIDTLARREPLPPTQSGPCAHRQPVRFSGVPCRAGLAAAVSGV